MQMKPTEVKVKSTKDQTLNTGFDVYTLTKGEVFVAKFKNTEQLNSLVDIGVIEIAVPDAPIIKPVPVILRSDSGVELPLSNVPHPKNIFSKDLEKESEVRTKPYSLAEMNEMLAR